MMNFKATAKCIALASVLTFVSCEKHTAKEAAQDIIAAASSGLGLRIKNELPKEQKNGSELAPELNVLVCPKKFDGGLIDQLSDKTQDCYQVEGNVANGDSKLELINKDRAAQLYDKGHGEIIFFIRDTGSDFNFVRPCDGAPTVVKTDSDSKQVIKVTINNRQLNSYSCHIEVE